MCVLIITQQCELSIANVRESHFTAQIINTKKICDNADDV